MIRFIGVILLLVSFTSEGQVTRYWNISLNAEGALLGGAAIAGDIGGPGSIFYNPALITGGYQANFSFNASLGSIDSYAAKNLFGDNLNIGDTKVRFKPRFFSLFLRPKSNPRLSFELASFAKDEEVIESNEGFSGTRDIFNSLGGEEILNGYINYTTRSQESWYGLGGSYILSEKVTLGLTTFIVDKNTRSQTIFNYSVFPQTDTAFQGSTPVPFFVSAVDSYSRHKLSNFRNLFKAGFAYTTDGLSFGLTITTPSWSAIGTGESARSIRLINIPNQEETGFSKDIILSDSQNRLRAGLKDPWSFAAGLTYRSNDQRNLISASAEYFTGIGAYKAIVGEINENITNRDIYDQLAVKDVLSRTHGGNQILNFAVGYQRITAKGNAIMTGFRTDYDYLQNFNYGDLSDYTPLKQVSYNVYHVTFGGQFKVLKNSIVGGFRYSFGSDKEPFFNLVGGEIPSPPDEVNNPGQNATFTYVGLSLFAGFTLNFGQDVASYLTNKVKRD